MKQTTAILTLTALTLLMGTSVTLAQIPGDVTRDIDWQVAAIGGYFVGDLLIKTEINGEPVRGELDTGWLTGVRFGGESEYFGLEATVAGVFTDLDIKADPAAGLPSSEDATLLLANLDALWFPVGNEWADGRVRFFVAAGPGLMHINTDLSEADGETAFDVNVGLGLKCLLGDQGNPVLRFDYRWHATFGSNAGLEDMSSQEMTVGLGIRF